jgi:hypothetical protein
MALMVRNMIVNLLLAIGGVRIASNSPRLEYSMMPISGDARLAVRDLFSNLITAIEKDAERGLAIGIMPTKMEKKTLGVAKLSGHIRSLWNGMTQNFMSRMADVQFVAQRKIAEHQPIHFPWITIMRVVREKSSLAENVLADFFALAVINPLNALNPFQIGQPEPLIISRGIR